MKCCSSVVTKGDKYTSCQNSPKWQELPLDIWKKVFERLDILDFIMFVCVCKEFRSISTCHPHVSNIAVFIRNSLNESDELEFVSFNDSLKYKISLPKRLEDGHSWMSIGNSFGYLIFYSNLGSSHEILLWNPLNKIEIPFPPIQKNIKKATLSINPIKKDRTLDKDLFMICASDYDIYISRLEDLSWTYIARFGVHIDDLLYHEDKLYVTCKRGPVISFYLFPDRKKLQRFVIDAHVNCCGSYLSKSCKGELLLIQKICLEDDKYTMEVRKLNEGKTQWTPTSLVNDYCLLLEMFYELP